MTILVLFVILPFLTVMSALKHGSDHLFVKTACLLTSLSMLQLVLVVVLWSQTVLIVHNYQVTPSTVQLVSVDTTPIPPVPVPYVNLL